MKKEGVKKKVWKAIKPASEVNKMHAKRILQKVAVVGVIVVPPHFLVVVMEVIKSIDANIFVILVEVVHVLPHAIKF